MLAETLFDWDYRIGPNFNEYCHCELKSNAGYFKEGDKFESIIIDEKAGTITFLPYKKDSLDKPKPYVFKLYYSIGECLSDT